MQKSETNTKTLKRILACIMVVVMTLTAVPLGALDGIGFTQTAIAAGGVEAKLNSLRSKYPNGYYWNHKVTDYSNNGDELVRNRDESFADSVTTSPCATHNGVASVGQYDCNYFDGGIQCYGFAGKVFYDVFGQRKSALTQIYDNKYGVQVGDYVRINNNGHSAVVLSKSGSNITVVECNLDKSGSYYNCMIRWDATYSIDSITFYCHATNYDAVNNTGDYTPTYFTSVSSSNVIDDTATITSTINLTYISSCGFYLGTSQSNLVKRHTETVNKNTEKIWYDIKNECGITLTHATTYYYKFYIVVNSKEYQSETKSFTTTGKHNYVSAITKQATCAAGGIMTYTCSCGKTYTETVPATGKHTNKTTTTKATTSKDGQIVKTCKVCKKTVKTTIYKASSIKLSKTSFTYNGKAQKPTVTVKNSKGTTLKNGTDYTVSYSSGCKNTGKYSVKVTFKGNYSGTKTLYFNILPSKTSKLTVTQTTTSIKATWNKVTGASGYKVTLYSSKDKALKTVYTTNTTYTFSKLSKGTTYKVRVTAYKTIDSKKVSSSVYTQLTTATKTDAPSIKVTSTAKKTAKVSWSKVSGATGYTVYYSTSKNGTYKKLATTTSTSYTNKKLSSGKTYYFKVIANKKVGSTTINSAYSAVKSVKIK